MSFSNDPNSLQSQIPISQEFPKDPELFRQTFYQAYQRIVQSLNSKEGGLYLPQEKTTGQQYFTENDPQKNQNVYRTVVNFGALPNNSEKTVPHNIPWGDRYRLTRLYGGATDPNTKKGISVPNDQICLENDDQNIIITTTADYSAYTSTTVVIEYTKG